ncbi:DUF2158 domain-containing protein [Occallatibacter riparius]|nr:DUF2158 domain-containing protein [Occallatibacter riparius]
MPLKLYRGICVRLKSGGPMMVIFGIDEAGVYCRWLEGGKLKDDIFDAADLEPATQREVAAALDTPRKP